METVVEEHDERGSQSVSAKEDKGDDGNDLKDAFLDIEERDNSISESKSQNHGKSQIKIQDLSNFSSNFLLSPVSFEFLLFLGGHHTPNWVGGTTVTTLRIAHSTWLGTCLFYWIWVVSLSFSVVRVHMCTCVPHSCTIHTCAAHTRVRFVPLRTHSYTHTNY